MKIKMKNILSILLFVGFQTLAFAQGATIDFVNKTVSGNEITFEVVLRPDVGTTIYLGNFDVKVNVPTTPVSSAVRFGRAGILSADGTNVLISTSISSDGKNINFQPAAPGEQSDFDAFIAKITAQVSLGTYKITFASPPSGTVSCDGGTFFTLAPVNPWTSSSVTTNCSLVPLPLKLLDFSAKMGVESVNPNVLLTWQTAQERNVDYFEVQKRDANSNDFKPFNKATAKNGTQQSYDLVDENPFPNTTYYRLKMVDNDGSFTYSAVKTVVFEVGKKANFSVFPNPTSDNLTVQFASNQQEKVAENYVVINLLGQVLLQGKFSGNDLDISSLPSGAFILKMGAAQAKFFKQ